MSPRKNIHISIAGITKQRLQELLLSGGTKVYFKSKLQHTAFCTFFRESTNFAEYIFAQNGTTVVNNLLFSIHNGMQMGYLFIEAIQDFFLGLIHKLHMTIKKGHLKTPTNESNIHYQMYCTLFFQ